MLGTDLTEVLAARGEDVVELRRPDLDITDTAQVAQRVRDVDVVVNCAGWTAVDAAEQQEAQAFGANAVGPQLLARAARSIGARMVHISTDYVFDGTAGEPYPETAPLLPRSAYGRTKAAGEWVVRAECPDHLIVRTAWLYGAHGPCFPRAMARLATEQSELTVVGDQIGQPTWSRDLAELVVRLVKTGVPAGTYHGTATGAVSWHGFAVEILQGLGHDPAIVRQTTSAAFIRPAPRPAYSVLAHRALHSTGIEPIGPWAQRWRAAAPLVLPPT